MFGHHHYLSADFNKAANVYLIFWSETLVGFCAVLPNPSGTIKYNWRIHRLVILPDYQGLGIGTKVCDFISKMYVDNGFKFTIRSSHIRLYKHCKNSNEYRECSNSGQKCKEIMNTSRNPYMKTRIAYTFEYVGSDYYNKPHKTIVIDNGEVITREELLKLKEKYYLIVVTGKTKEDNETELLCKELGIRTELLYRTSKGKLVRRKYQ